MIIVKKTKAPLKKGELVRPWGTGWKKALPTQKGPIWIVSELLPDNEIVLFNGSGGFITSSSDLEPGDVVEI